MQSRRDRQIDFIDQLVDEQLARGETRDEVGQDRCELCGGDWHGGPWNTYTAAGDLDTLLEHDPDCPGAYGTDEL